MSQEFESPIPHKHKTKGYKMSDKFEKLDGMVKRVNNIVDANVRIQKAIFENNLDTLDLATVSQILNDTNTLLIELFEHSLSEAQEIDKMRKDHIKTLTDFVATLDKQKDLTALSKLIAREEGRQEGIETARLWTRPSWI
jgi:hypothetical protein